MIGQLIELFVVFAGWSFKRSPSSSGNGRLVLWQSSSSGDGRLVLATVVWFWRRSSGSGDGRLVLGRSSGSGDGRLVLGRSSSSRIIARALSN